MAASNAASMNSVLFPLARSRVIPSRVTPYLSVSGSLAPIIHLRPYCHRRVPGIRANHTRPASRLRPLLPASTPRSIRSFQTSVVTRHGEVKPPRPGQELWITFADKDGSEHKFAVSEGDNLLDIAQANDMDMEGACGGSCACSTCHIIVTDENFYSQMPEPSDDENDMLDLAFGLTETSRLGCQVKMTKSLDGVRVQLPAMTRNMQATDFQLAS